MALSYQNPSTTWLHFSEETVLAITPYISAATTTSSGTVLGIGTDLGRVLYWIGEHVIGAAIDIAIRRRLASISLFLKRRERIKRLLQDDKGMHRLHGVCADLLELCRPEYSVKVRRKALALILTLLRPIDALSSSVLESDFAEVLVVCELDGSRDPVIVSSAAEFTRVFNAYWAIPCHCAVCLRALNVELESSLQAKSSKRRRSLAVRNLLRARYPVVVFPKPPYYPMPKSLCFRM